MKVYNTGSDQKVQELTPDFLEKLTEFAESFRKMMQEADPAFRTAWEYSEVRISDLGFTDGIKFSFGSLDDLPDYFPPRFRYQKIKVLIRSKYEIENKGGNDAKSN